jgi:hypothetical protein
METIATPFETQALCHLIGRQVAQGARNYHEA